MLLLHYAVMENCTTVRKAGSEGGCCVLQGAKLFYLSGMVNGEYQKTEIHNLGRFISVMKFRPLVWRSTHPYLIADRYVTYSTKHLSLSGDSSSVTTQWTLRDHLAVS